MAIATCWCSTTAIAFSTSCTALIPTETEAGTPLRQRSGICWRNEQRPWTWTSADAAGLPIFPGLVRYDEVAAGQIQHAIRFTLPQSRAAMVLPATHWAANSTSANAPPMGMRLRLKAGYDISGFSTNMQVILTAMKKYGLIMADNGSAMYISGAPDSRWDNDDLHNLGQVPASAFEVVQMGTVYTGIKCAAGSGSDHRQLSRQLQPA